ncbi:Vacuolar protein sorting-associated protein 36 [Capsicum annuum]|uniref:Vacuolar protein-sorting-associated protein 36 n=1 Tax=Capsicum annuum TaxID=4072 RepID=A0A2G2YYZ3_CAPAN|nr:Vacuolar protein sorting-associated protein 36 [Capsicum annuum]
MPVFGVAGILRKEQEMWESTDKSLQDAFQDLNALMNKAKEMVTLAEKMRAKLLSGSTSQATCTNDEEIGTKEEMQELLLSVGIVSPVTKESAGALYHQQLSRQEVWVRFAYTLTSQDPTYGITLDQLCFGSLTVVSWSSRAKTTVMMRIRSMVTTPDALREGVTASDAAMTLGIAPAMAKEHLLAAEGKGLLCRDVGPDGFRFFVNLLQEIDADDIFL